MKKIVIFFVASQSLDNLRDTIETRLSKLANYEEFNDIKIVFKHCENSGDIQGEYNCLITEKADLAFFLFDEHVGIFSLEEFLRASIGHEENGHPQISIFLNEKNGHNTFIHDIETILNRTSGCYSVRYKDETDLQDLVVDRVRQFRRNQKKHKLNILWYRWKKRCFGWIMLFVAACSLGLIFFSNINTKSEEKPNDIILLSGGGTLEGFFLSNFDLDITHQPNMVYVPLPSKAAWQLVYEEMSKLSYEENNCRPYYPLILSSKKATDSDFVPEEQQDEFRQNIGYIAEIQVGNDTLQVIMSKKLGKDYNGNITDEQLANLLLEKTDEINLFSTTIGKSGTFIQYQDILKKHRCNLDSIPKNVFYRKQKADYFNDGEKPFVILGSNGYNPVNLKDTTRLKLIKTSDHSLICNPLYVYTILYKYNGKYVVRKSVIDFLSKVGITDFPNAFTQIPSQKLVHEYDINTKQLK